MFPADNLADEAALENGNRGGGGFFGATLGTAPLALLAATDADSATVLELSPPVASAGSALMATTAPMLRPLSFMCVCTLVRDGSCVAVPCGAARGALKASGVPCGWALTGGRCGAARGAMEAIGVRGSAMVVARSDNNWPNSNNTEDLL